MSYTRVNASRNQALTVSPQFWWRFVGNNRIAKSIGLTKVNGATTMRGNAVYTKNGKFYTARGNILRQFNYKGPMNANFRRLYILNKNGNLKSNNIHRLIELRNRLPGMNLRGIYNGPNNAQIKRNYEALLKYQMLRPNFNQRLRKYLAEN